MDSLINKVREITEELIRFTPFRIVDVEHKQFKSKHTFTVYLDSMNGLTVSDCKQFTRRINEAMELCPEFDESYILAVSSPGIERPIRFDWQFMKNIGRKIEVIYTDDTGQEQQETAKLVEYQDQKIILQPESKKKKISAEKITISLNSIKSAKIQIEWN